MTPATVTPQPPGAQFARSRSCQENNPQPSRPRDQRRTLVNSMTPREYLTELENLPHDLDPYLRGGIECTEAQVRLLPGLRALCELALANQAPTENTWADQVRAVNSRQLAISL